MNKILELPKNYGKVKIAELHCMPPLHVCFVMDSYLYRYFVFSKQYNNSYHISITKCNKCGNKTYGVFECWWCIDEDFRYLGKYIQHGVTF